MRLSFLLLGPTARPIDPILASSITVFLSRTSRSPRGLVALSPLSVMFPLTSFAPSPMVEWWV
jgi:hypothetical protein